MIVRLIEKSFKAIKVTSHVQKLLKRRKKIETQMLTQSEAVRHSFAENAEFYMRKSPDSVGLGKPGANMPEGYNSLNPDKHL